MKLFLNALLISGLFTTAQAMASEQIIKIDCNNLNGSTVIEAIVDAETGEKNSFEIVGSGKSFQMTFFETDPAAMQTKGALLEVFAESENTGVILALLEKADAKGNNATLRMVDQSEKESVTALECSVSPLNKPTKIEVLTAPKSLAPSNSYGVSMALNSPVVTKPTPAAKPNAPASTPTPPPTGSPKAAPSSSKPTPPSVE